MSVLTIDTNWWLWHVLFVPRQLRIQYPGAIDHVMNRGDLTENARTVSHLVMKRFVFAELSFVLGTW
ncbi:hypothetical protein SBV1_1420051 [Verrucomicrobia bacterium]|nr:hypothetical protein SBV1_1420051 [Verrucomicrobiota bacterium]